MDTNAIILRGRSALLHCIKRSSIFSASFLVLDRTKNKPSEYISALVHEVRNPLSTINLAVEMLESTHLDEEQKEYLNIISRGSCRIKGLVNTMLTSGQIGEYTSEFYSLRQLLEEVLTMATDRMQLKKIKVRREYTATDHRIMMDKEKMKIALANIITNAIEAMPSGTGELTLATKSVGEQSFIEIQDNGIGISQEHLKRIFEPHFSNKPGGMGLGLSTTLDILRANHARVDVRSVEGVGTCFILSFFRG